MARYHEMYVNDLGTQVSVLDLGSTFVVWDHEHAMEIGQAGDPESARQMING